MIVSLFSALLLGFFFLVNAAPTTSPAELLAFGPTILSPTNATIWSTGSQQQVLWLTSNVPQEAQNYTLQVVLGFLANNSENLDTDHPLAQNVSIMDGNVTITVPTVTTRNDYIVVLIGTSGDRSPTFTINAV